MGILRFSRRIGEDEGDPVYLVAAVALIIGFAVGLVLGLTKFGVY